MHTIPFRYTNHSLFNLVSAVLALGLIGGALLVLQLFTGSLQAASAAQLARGTAGIPYIVALGAALLAGIALLFFAARLLARRLCERTGTARLYETCVEIQAGRKTFSHPYSEITISQQDSAVDERAEEKVAGPFYLRLTLLAGGERLVLGASIREADRAFGSTGFWPRLFTKPHCPRTSLDDVLDALRPRVAAVYVCLPMDALYDRARAEKQAKKQKKTEK